jgi:cob(I)alamin adenosyltransferase
MSPFYTKLGDFGDTGILGPGRVSKASLRIEAVGSVDEASSALGLARSLSESDTTNRILIKVQRTLYSLMTELSAAPSVAQQFDRITEQDVQWIEEEIAKLEEVVEIPREFILPGINPASSALALSRTIVRRAERRVIELFNAQELNKEILIAYLNRLSSLIFILEIHEITLSDQSLELAKED